LSVRGESEMKEAVGVGGGGALFSFLAFPSSWHGNCFEGKKLHGEGYS